VSRLTVIEASRLRRLCLASSGAALVLPFLVAPQIAQADTRLGGVVGADAGYSTRPFGDSGSGPGAATLTGRATVRLNHTHATGKASADASVSHTEYSRVYDGKTNYNAGASLSEQLSERTTFGLNGRFDSSVVDSNDVLLNPIFSDLDPLLPPVIDPSSAFLQRQRRNSYSAGASLDHRLSEFDTISVSGKGVATRFSRGGGGLREYDYFSSTLAYSRQVSARLSLGGSFTAARSNYLDTILGDAWTYSPQLTAKLLFDGGWSLSASGGVTFSDTETPTGKQRSTGASGSVQLCKRDERFSGCLTASRSVLPSSLGGVGNATSIGVSASYRLDEFSTLSGNASYSRNSGGSFSQSQDFLRSTISYSRRLTERLSGVVSAGYSDSYNGLIMNRANLSGTIGVSYSFGAL
jgi:hypothetical protein